MNQQSVATAVEECKINFKKIVEYFSQNQKRLLFFGVALLFILSKDIGWEMNSTNMNIASINDTVWAEWAKKKTGAKVKEGVPIMHNGKVVGDEWEDSLPTDRSAPESTEMSIWTKVETNNNGDNLANTFSNLTFWADAPKRKEKQSAKMTKRKKQMQYVKRFAKTAQVEMEKYGIPASITLAQGLLESNVGESRLATRNNNHFGMKCFSKKCKAGHCSNYTDDTHKDFFRKYSSVWESFRAHSKLLQAKRYKGLYLLEKTDYKAWAHGLKKAGYATDKKYAFKIIQLIEDLNLSYFDK